MGLSTMLMGGSAGLSVYGAIRNNDALDASSSAADDMKAYNVLRNEEYERERTQQLHRKIDDISREHRQERGNMIGSQAKGGFILGEGSNAMDSIDQMVTQSMDMNRTIAKSNSDLHNSDINTSNANFKLDQQKYSMEVKKQQNWINMTSDLLSIGTGYIGGQSGIDAADGEQSKWGAIFNPKNPDGSSKWSSFNLFD